MSKPIFNQASLEQIRQAQAAATSGTTTCPHCIRGTVDGPNNTRLRCAYCQGTGQIIEEPK